jgi:hypothetical protein
MVVEGAPKPFFDRMFTFCRLRQISLQELAPNPLEGAEPLWATIHASWSAKYHIPNHIQISS